MQPILRREDKATTATFIPYRNKNGVHEYFLQMRDGKAPTNPNIFGMFGGSIERGENPVDAVLREIQEELSYIPKNLQYLSEFETDKVRHIFIEEVKEDFESEVAVCEGEYGKFLKYDDIAHSSDVAHNARTILHVVHSFLQNKKG